MLDILKAFVLKNGYFFVLIAFVIGEFHGRYQTNKKFENRELIANALADKKQQELQVEYNKKQTILQDKVNKIDEQAKKEQLDAQSKMEALRHQLSSGAVRLSVATRQNSANSCARNAGNENKETRVEILPSVAESIFRIGLDADNVVRQLNACIDQYQAVKSLSSPQTP